MIENWQDVELTMNAVAGVSWTRVIAPLRDNVPGRIVLQLAPGHYEFIHSGIRGPYNIDGKVSVDIKGGELLVSPMYRNGRYDEWVYPLPPPAGCPGGPTVFLSPTPAPTVGPCPGWFATPAPNKGILILESHFPRELNVVGVSGIALDTKVAAKKDDNPGWLMLQLNAGKYSIDITFGFNVNFEIAAGQILGASVYPNAPLKIPTYNVQVPASCR